jgi:trimeric autotransporter adhesin
LSDATTASNNTAVGRSALSSTTTASNNTAVGYYALVANTTGASNTAVGYSAGASVTTGSNNLILGYDADTAAVDSDNSVTLGNASIATIRCQVQTISSLSDARDKKNIEPLPVGLDFINALNPVKFTWDMRDGAKVDIDEAGFIAQELDQAQQDHDAEDYLQLVLKDNPEKLEASYGKLVPALVKAIQEQTALITALTARITTLEG